MRKTQFLLKYKSWKDNIIKALQKRPMFKGYSYSEIDNALTEVFFAHLFPKEYIKFNKLYIDLLVTTF